MRPSLPYQGIARRAMVEPIDGKWPVYDRDIDVSAVVIKELQMNSENTVRRNYLRNRLGDTGNNLNDYPGRNHADVEKPRIFVFTDEALDAFLELAAIGFSKSATDDQVVSGAYIYALMSQIPIEAGREYRVVDNGMVIDPPNVSDKLLELVRIEAKMRYEE